MNLQSYELEKGIVLSFEWHGNKFPNFFLSLVIIFYSFLLLVCIPSLQTVMFALVLLFHSITDFQSHPKWILTKSFDVWLFFINMIVCQRQMWQEECFTVFQDDFDNVFVEHINVKSWCWSVFSVPFSNGNKVLAVAKIKIEMFTSRLFLRKRL